MQLRCPEAVVRHKESVHESDHRSDSPKRLSQHLRYERVECLVNLGVRRLCGTGVSWLRYTRMALVQR
eukprot:12908141-Prorocentrum_lima.AAC.1